MRISALVLITLILMCSIVFAEVSNYKDALSLYQKGNYKAAAQNLKERVENNPDPYAYYLLGYANYKMKKHSEAMKYFRETYVLDPTFTPPPLKK
jgi:TolA-binding protein